MIINLLKCPNKFEFRRFASEIARFYDLHSAYVGHVGKCHGVVDIDNGLTVGIEHARQFRTLFYLWVMASE